MALLLAGFTTQGFSMQCGGFTTQSPLGAATSRPALHSLQMKVPGEGNPFSAEAKANAPEPVWQPRAIADGTGNKQYIEVSDEPWHDTCINTTPISMTTFSSCADSALPFIAPEEALEEALTKCGSATDIEKAVAKCLAAGGREGCAAIGAAEKLKKDMAKAAKDGSKAPKYVFKKAKIGGDKPGWPNQGEKRSIAVTHDNSI